MSRAWQVEETRGREAGFGALDAGGRVCPGPSHDPRQAHHAAGAARTEPPSATGRAQLAEAAAPAPTARKRQGDAGARTRTAREGSWRERSRRPRVERARPEHAELRGPGSSCRGPRGPGVPMGCGPRILAPTQDRPGRGRRLRGGRAGAPRGPRAHGPPRRAGRGQGVRGVHAHQRGVATSGGGTTGGRLQGSGEQEGEGGEGHAGLGAGGTGRGRREDEVQRQDQSCRAAGGARRGRVGETESGEEAKQIQPRSLQL